MFIIRIPYSLLQWLLFIVLKLVAVLIGLFAVIVAIKVYGYQSRLWPKWLWLWGNDEEELPLWWMNKAKDENWFIRRYAAWWWYAVRNPVNNHRFLFEEPQEYTQYGDKEVDITPGWRYRHAGWMDSFRVTWGKLKVGKGLHEFYIGWKIGSSTPGVGFTFQWR